MKTTNYESDSKGYVATLYSATGAVLASAYMPQESGPVPGWQVAQFASPVSISASTTYVAAYYAPSGKYADQYNGLSQGTIQGTIHGPLNVPASATVGGNGVYSYGQTFPTSTSKNDNYFVDVLFTPIASRSYLSLSFNPPNPSIAADAALGTAVTTVTATWSDGTAFMGSLSFGPPYSNDQGVFAISGNKVMINPSGPGLTGLANTTQNITVQASSGVNEL
jgi:hypothetical protein